MTDRRDGWGEPPRGNERRQRARRRSDRVDVAFWVERSEGDSVTYQRAGNLSTGGLYLASPLPLPPGSVTMLEFHLPGDRTPIRCGGEVRSATTGDRPGMNIQFFELSDEDRGRIERFIDALQLPDPLSLDPAGRS